MINGPGKLMDTVVMLAAVTFCVGFMAGILISAFVVTGRWWLAGGVFVAAAAIAMNETSDALWLARIELTDILDEPDD